MLDHADVADMEYAIDDGDLADFKETVKKGQQKIKAKAANTVPIPPAAPPGYPPGAASSSGAAPALKRLPLADPATGVWTNEQVKAFCPPGTSISSESK